jgi:hypothetical protein
MLSQCEHHSLMRSRVPIKFGWAGKFAAVFDFYYGNHLVDLKLRAVF